MSTRSKSQDERAGPNHAVRCLYGDLSGLKNSIRDTGIRQTGRLADLSANRVQRLFERLDDIDRLNGIRVGDLQRVLAVHGSALQVVST